MLTGNSRVLVSDMTACKEVHKHAKLLLKHQTAAPLTDASVPTACSRVTSSSMGGEESVLTAAGPSPTFIPLILRDREKWKIRVRWHKRLKNRPKKVTFGRVSSLGDVTRSASVCCREWQWRPFVSHNGSIEKGWRGSHTHWMDARQSSTHTKPHVG